LEISVCNKNAKYDLRHFGIKKIFHSLKRSWHVLRPGIIQLIKIKSMKKVILIVLCCFAVGLVYSQKIVKEHYTISAGVLGAADFSKFRDKNPANIDYDLETGWSGGGWINFPVSKGFSIEPQVMYNSLRYQTKSMDPSLMNNGIIRYVSVPLLFKFHAGDKFAFTLGPQIDFVNSVKDKNVSFNGASKSDFTSPSVAATGGVEVFPHGRVTIFGRYAHGFTNMDDRSNAETDNEYNTQNIQVGLKLKIFGKKVPADSDGDGVVGLARYDGCPIPDSDNDGINDEEDKCPNEAGIAKYNGCPIPDTDKDGINDEQDKCPNQPGIAKYNGCPIPDTDGDGVNDEEDKCPNEAGPASRQGCPVKDRDNDGVNDEDDKCPDIAGTAANNGCPEIPANVSKSIASTGKNITFTGSTAKLASKSYASLNQVVSLMRDNPTLKIRIEGHTDNAGNDDANMKLSEDRAAAVKAYIVSKGISEDRITSQGFGETAPIANNNTASGRAQNRRVEIKVDY
jgi:outer membrane protein OmpA-like peptidoglycan-associated protein